MCRGFAVKTSAPVRAWARSSTGAPGAADQSDTAFEGVCCSGVPHGCAARTRTSSWSTWVVALPLCGAPQEDEPACGLTPIVALAQNHQVVRTLVIRDRSRQVAPLDVSPGGRQRGAGA